MLRKSIFTALICFATLAMAQSASRHFTFHYEFTVGNTAAGQRLRVWVPLAHSDDYQDVKVLSMTGDLPLRKTREHIYANELLYAETANADKPEYHFAVIYDIVRRERVADLHHARQSRLVPLSARESQMDLKPDRLVPTSGLPAELAAKETQGSHTQLEKARAVYEYVFHNMKYDKTGTGWGRGDTLYACDAKKGNCTDFHSLFISMARSQGIPARFEIGFPLPGDKTSGEIAGYHCWSDFYVNDIGWVPVDISEAWKHQEKHDYFFGAHDANRVQFTMGRDLVLSPPQDGQPLNYLVYPYVELGGRDYPNVSNKFAFEDVGASSVAAK
jgi:transglutaminase-like putative cysteine protease